MNYSFSVQRGRTDHTSSPPHVSPGSLCGRVADQRSAGLGMGAYDDYLSAIVDRFWNYAEREFGDRPELFDRSERSPSRSPVFVVGATEHNLLYPPRAEPRVRQAIATSLPTSERHRHFASMRSSQALAQSVFGSLAALGKAGVLAGLTADDGLPTVRSGVTVQMEYLVEHLGEPRSTSVDVWLDDGKQQVAVECKFTEREFGRCSRPTLRPGRNANYERDYCDGTYTRQRGRRARCSLTESGVRYWQYLPELFDWSADRNMKPCPLDGTYQLARNVLAACVRPGGSAAGCAVGVGGFRDPAHLVRRASRPHDSPRLGVRAPSLALPRPWRRPAPRARRPLALLLQSGRTGRCSSVERPGRQRCTPAW